MNLPPFGLERWFARYEFQARWLLGSSDCESWSVEELLALEPGADGRFLRQRLGYTESAGSPSLRQAICSLYGTIGPDHVLVHAGAEEAVFLFMHALLRAGDHLIVHSPCYQSLGEVAAAIGCRVTPWTAREEEGWAPDVAQLRRLVRPRTRAIVLNTPHNPTGCHLSPEAFGEVSRIAQESGLVLFCDEVYRESEHRAEDRLPAACDLGEHAVSLGVMSKTYGLAGLRIGWIATRNAALLGRMAALKDYTTICNSAPSEFLAELALRHRGRLVERNVGIIKANLELLDGFFRRQAGRLQWQRPRAGPVGFARLAGEPAEAFCEALVRETGVLLVPGGLFGDPGNHVRLGFGRRNLPEALERLEDFLDRRRP